ncbi:MAG: hypothetical protein DRO04_00090 [Candidatus Iainarchaeum archaeon]|uniref:Uncharacterized protein n=1 Tax=Candidatus Iainarchaeum sp. TaxID=3101447 RepID=A0A497JI80_9ARCH|nr:MAG: hypothetical protein DRO04_00090 [Candidatus Diapherotrites archaeon]
MLVRNTTFALRENGVYVIYVFREDETVETEARRRQRTDVSAGEVVHARAPDLDYLPGPRIFQQEGLDAETFEAAMLAHNVVPANFLRDGSLAPEVVSEEKHLPLALLIHWKQYLLTEDTPAPSDGGSEDAAGNFQVKDDNPARPRYAKHAFADNLEAYGLKALLSGILVEHFYFPLEPLSITLQYSNFHLRLLSTIK